MATLGRASASSFQVQRIEPPEATEANALASTRALYRRTSIPAGHFGGRDSSLIALGGQVAVVASDITPGVVTNYSSHF